MIQSPFLLVFSDLDGTLLDHDTYGWAPAKPALARLARAGCPVVLTSSKTAAEICVLQAEMGLTPYPAIVENGAGVIGLPDQSDRGGNYNILRSRLAQIPPDLRTRFEGFGDMSLARLVELTGLTSDTAKLAQDRRFSEPGLWHGDTAERARFLHEVDRLGLTATEGGRFLTVSFGGTKAEGMTRVAEVFKPQHTLALGDAPNDITMLEAADFGVVIANPHRAALPPLTSEAEGRISRTSEAGPTGWNTAVCALLERLEQI